MTFCRHEPHQKIDHIKEPKYSTDEILINADNVKSEHLLIKFVNCSKYPDWFYMSGKMVRKHRTQQNGAGTVHVVPMSKRQIFTPITQCNHEI